MSLHSDSKSSFLLWLQIVYRTGPENLKTVSCPKSQIQQDPPLTGFGWTQSCTFGTTCVSFFLGRLVFQFWQRNCVSYLCLGCNTLPCVLFWVESHYMFRTESWCHVGHPVNYSIWCLSQPGWHPGQNIALISTERPFGQEEEVGVGDVHFS